VSRLNGGCSGVLLIAVGAVLEPSFVLYSFVADCVCDRIAWSEHRCSWW